MSYNFSTLVKTLYQSHQKFEETWKKHGIGFRKSEPKEITEARNVFNTAFKNLFNELKKYQKDFCAGDSNAIDSIINFLEIDIPAFRCGYAKEKYFRKLKLLSLNEKQKERLRNLAFNLCLSDSYRREFRDLVRLMIKIADKQFIERLKMLENESEEIVKFKTRTMLENILQTRKDLQ
jgi:hypothetical protein